MKGLKTGGREQGTLNRVTQLQREFIQSLLDSQQDKIKCELNSLTGKDYLSVITGLMEYAMPKLQQTELTSKLTLVGKELEDEIYI
ncbi:MAG: hypothetical protein NTY07_02255 [Bacteroidia bacterium]|nr:hypothetical protein [Bacteroidia bacterium]